MERKIPLRARLARRAVRRLAQMVRYRRLSLTDVPILFANSFPKSGTHLLTQVLQGFSALGPAVDSGLPAVVMYDGFDGRLRTESEISTDLKRFLPADIGYGHMHAIPPAVSFMKSPTTAAYFILRDPRDVAVSHVHYITDMEPHHIHHRYYAEELHNFEERLCVSILGRSEVNGSCMNRSYMNGSFPSIAARFEPFLGWLETSAVMIIRYEDFITERVETLRRIVAHAVKAGFPVYERDQQRVLEIMERAIDPLRSPTFRRGTIHAWKDDFSASSKRLFKETAGDLLIRLGYERDYDW